MSDGEKMPHVEAMALCNEIVNQLSRFCDDIRVAGSLRRRQEMVGDIELVIRPKFLSQPKIEQTSLINSLPDVAINLPEKNLTFMALKEMTALYGGDWFRLAPENKKDGNRYKKFQVKGMDRQWVQVDMFFAAPNNFGLIYLMRTGPREFSKYMLTGHKDRGALPHGHYCKDGYLRHLIDEIIVPIPTEKELFDLTGFQYLDPVAREDWKRTLTLKIQQRGDVDDGWEKI